MNAAPTTIGTPAGLASLAKPQPYRAVGWSNAGIIAVALAGAVAANAVGFLMAMICALARRPSPGVSTPTRHANAIPGLDWFSDLLLATPLCLIFVFAYGVWAIRYAQVRRILPLMALTLLWATAYVDGLFIFHLPKEPQNWVAAALLASALFAVMFILLFDPALRVFYRVGGGTRATESFAFFRSRTGHMVLHALSSGDREALSALRTQGPQHGLSLFHLPFHYENYTVVVLSTCPGHPELPGYLRIVDVLCGNYTTRRRTRMQLMHTALSDARIAPDDMSRLESLIPGLVPVSNVSGARTQRSIPPPFPITATTYASSGQGSWLLGLQHQQWRNLKARYRIGWLLCWGLLIAITYAHLSGAWDHHAMSGGVRNVAEEFPGFAAKHLSPANLALFVAFILIGWKCNWAVLAGVRNGLRGRDKALFRPGRNTLVLAVKDCVTGEREVALAEAQDGVVLIEMSRARLRIRESDLSMECIPSHKGAPLRLTAKLGDRTWAAYVSDLSDRGGVALRFGDPMARAERLRDKLRQRLGMP